MGSYGLVLAPALVFSWLAARAEPRDAYPFLLVLARSWGTARASVTCRA